jgi:hypothetical protein
LLEQTTVETLNFYQDFFWFTQSIDFDSYKVERRNHQAFAPIKRDEYGKPLFPASAGNSLVPGLAWHRDRIGLGFRFRMVG